MEIELHLRHDIAATVFADGIKDLAADLKKVYQAGKLFCAITNSIGYTKPQRSFLRSAAFRSSIKSLDRNIDPDGIPQTSSGQLFHCFSLCGREKPCKDIVYLEAETTFFGYDCARNYESILLQKSKTWCNCYN